MVPKGQVGAHWFWLGGRGGRGRQLSFPFLLCPTVPARVQEAQTAFKGRVAQFSHPQQILGGISRRFGLCGDFGPEALSPCLFRCTSSDAVGSSNHRPEKHVELHRSAQTAGHLGAARPRAAMYERRGESKKMLQTDISSSQKRVAHETRLVNKV
jgi:hypothetical protein